MTNGFTVTHMECKLCDRMRAIAENKPTGDPCVCEDPQFIADEGTVPRGRVVFEKPLDKRVNLVAAKAMVVFGKQPQVLMAIEEMGELTKCLAKHANGRVISSGDICSEIADVTIMVAQMRIAFGAEQVDEQLSFKLDRLEGRLNEATS